MPDVMVDPASPASVRDFIGQQVGGIAKLTVPQRRRHPSAPDDPTAPVATRPRQPRNSSASSCSTIRCGRRASTSTPRCPSTCPLGWRSAGRCWRRIHRCQRSPRQPSRPAPAARVISARRRARLARCSTSTPAAKVAATPTKTEVLSRRRAMASLTKLRSQPLFLGDALVDALPTLTDIYSVNGQQVITTPALFYHNNPRRPGTTVALMRTGRLDELDSVGRQSRGWSASPSTTACCSVAWVASRTRRAAASTRSTIRRART